MIFKKRIQLSKTVQNDEPLARYIFSKHHFSEEKKRVKRQAFLPPKNKNKISVIRHKDCPESCILKIGKKIEKIRNNSLKAFCSILTRDVRAINNLDVESDTSRGQHRRHANITINLHSYDEAKVRDIANSLVEVVNNNETLKIL